MKIRLLFALFLLQACQEHKNPIPLSDNSIPSSEKDIRQLSVVRLSNGFWGYDIWENDKTLIHQTTIPCFQGSSGMPDSLTASRIGLLVKQKLDSGIFPPTLDKRDIISQWPMNAPLPETYTND
jgi:hypothetical protein